MSEELHELHERAKRGREEPETVPVTVTLAILAVLIAATALLGERAHTEAMLFQTRATDQWAYYQAHAIRLHSDRIFLDELAALPVNNSPALDQLRASYQKEETHYRMEGAQLQAQARAFEDEVTAGQRRGNRFDLGEILLEASLVIVSVTLLVGWRFYWFAGMAVAAAGIVVAATAFFL